MEQIEENWRLHKDNYNKNEEFDFKKVIIEHLNELLNLSDKQHNAIYQKCKKLMNTTSKELKDFVKSSTRFQ